MSIYPLTGCLQDYAWGGKDYIPALFSLEKQQHPYFAEWWLGAHPSAPSQIQVNNQQQPLTQFIQQHPQVLGEKSRTKFGQELPFLLKILDVAKPLSIQLHPTKQQAEQGFLTENAKGVALTDSKRTYKDRNHKPEMMIALSDFWLLHGFNKKAAILAILNARPSLAPLAAKLQKQDLPSFYADIMQADQAQLASWLLPLIETNRSAYEKQHLSLDNPDYWLLYTMEAMNIQAEKLDAGLVCFYLFNIVHLRQGEGIFQDAGIPHAYLRGQNIELMACSDNVIRGGLTPKHVDIQALLDIVDCTEITPQIIPVAPQQSGVFTYQTPAADFALSQVTYQQGEQHHCHAKSAEILLVMEGEIKISQNHTALSLKKGQSVFIASDTNYQLEGVAQGYAVIAQLP